MLNFRDQSKYPDISTKDFGEIVIWDTRSNLNSSVSTNNKTRINKFVRDTHHKNHQLLHTLTISAWRDIFFDDFQMTCPITKYPAPFYKLNLGHFIPIHWGIGGSFVGNVFPIYGKLNTSMKHYNPLDYLRWENSEFPIHDDGVDFLISYLAEKNGLSVIKYEEYVNSCYQFYLKRR